MYRILLAEDNPGDVLLFREALRSSGVVCELVVAEDGEKAVQLIENGAQATNTPLDLIMLDINLPKRSGKEVLRWLRSDPKLAAVPVIILTSSASPDDRIKATQLGADLYIQKSSDLDEALEIGAIVQDQLAKKDRVAQRESPVARG
jgi:two-component system, chemotaxis family, response regulator Rcp1